MPTIIRHDNFCPISNLFTTDRTVFIIPIFQRPYAWEKDHIQDLLDDIDKAIGHKLRIFYQCQGP